LEGQLSGYIVWNGVYVALLDSSVCQVEKLVGLLFVSYGAFRRCFGEIRSFGYRVSFKRCLSKNLEGFLNDQERCWAKITV
jgi:hypothetical protein